MTTTDTLIASTETAIARVTVRHHANVRRSHATTGARGRIGGGLHRAARPLATVFAAGAAISLLGVLAIGELGNVVLGVPAGLRTLQPPDVFPYAFAPVVGCTVAFAVIFILLPPSARSRQLFLSVAIKFAVLDLVIAMLAMPGSASAVTIATVVAAVLYPLLIVPALLRFVPRPDAGRTQTTPAAG